MATYMATITSKGQVTIPRAIRRALRIEKGDRLYPGHEAIREEIHSELGEHIGLRRSFVR